MHPFVEGLFKQHPLTLKSKCKILHLRYLRIHFNAKIANQAGLKPCYGKIWSIWEKKLQFILERGFFQINCLSQKYGVDRRLFLKMDTTFLNHEKTIKKFYPNEGKIQILLQILGE